MSPGTAPIVRANRVEKRLDCHGEQSEAARTKPVIASSAAASGRPPWMKRVTSAAPTVMAGLVPAIHVVQWSRVSNAVGACS